MSKYVIFLMAVVAAHGAAMDNEDEVMPQAEGRVVGGTPINIDSVPYVVAIQMENNHLCSGAILNSRTVLTSARCVINKSEGILRVRAGSSYFNQLGVPIGLAAIKINPGYNPNTRENDLAVLRLAGALRFGTNINPIPLTTVTPPTGTPALIAGWGKTTTNYPTISEHLISSKLSIIRRPECRSDYYGYGSEIMEDHICAGSAVPGVGACLGDEGTPLVADNLLVGIASWGRGCGELRYPSVYINVALHRNWIINTTQHA